MIQLGAVSISTNWSCAHLPISAAIGASADVAASGDGYAVMAWPTYRRAGSPIVTGPDCIVDTHASIHPLPV